MRGSDVASVCRNARRPNPRMKVVPQVLSLVVQLAKIDSLLADAAQAAIASALSCSWDAFSSCTSRACASIAKPRLIGSWNTVPTGAAPVVSLKMARMLDANCGPVSRHSLRGPGVPAVVHAIGSVIACFGGVTSGPPPVPAVPVPAVAPEPVPAVPVSPVPAVPVPAVAPEPVPAVPAPVPAVPGPAPAEPELPAAPVIASPWPAQADAMKAAARPATRQGRSIKKPPGGNRQERGRSAVDPSVDGRARQSWAQVSFHLHVARSPSRNRL